MKDLDILEVQVLDVLDLEAVQRPVGGEASNVVARSVGLLVAVKLLDVHNELEFHATNLTCKEIISFVITK